MSTGRINVCGLALAKCSQPYLSQNPQYTQGFKVNPSGFVYGRVVLAEGWRNGGYPSSNAAFRNRAPEYCSFIGGLGYSRDRGASRGFPPGSILPFRFPALPQTPRRYSKR